jgi:alpha-beta hydrolase superfamily lysophospholipase
MVNNLSKKRSTPIIVVVPGAACKVVHYNDLSRQLTSNGYETYVYDLPTASREPPQKPATLADDADFFHDKIEDLVSAGKDVVVVAHSYGGMVATDAAQGLSTAARADQGLAGGVSRIVYLASIVAEVGETAGELTANLKFDFMKPVEVC